MKDRSLTYNTDYGIDRRSGWTACVDGIVIVQLTGFWRALWAFIFGR